ncbi:hypothetical protein CK203_065355 [Vitis vinifera]|uniref:Uncharacterized protein n=1 Tax=Vitis vinifera TaxID=29760 RepID=A0A438G2S7_VITVI|nr:hypothetical protein CK203_065355 [Vitis vinifera]
MGINLIFAGDQQNHMPMLEHPQNSGDNGSALQDTDVILEGTDGNRKRRRDDSLPEEPHYKRLGAPNTHLSL